MHPQRIYGKRVIFLFKTTTRECYADEEDQNIIYSRLITDPDDIKVIEIEPTKTEKDGKNEER